MNISGGMVPLLSMELSVFRGDGKYPYDGGRFLQKLWDLFVWREIRNCPGRYVCSSQHLKEISPRELVKMISDHDDVLVEFGIDSKDHITLCRFRDGGGLLTYTKPNVPDGPPTEFSRNLFVHTLNTESGLIRKVDALKIEPSVLLVGSCGSSTRFVLIVRVLSFLVDKEKNASATSLVRCFTRALFLFSNMHRTRDT